MRRRSGGWAAWLAISLLGASWPVIGHAADLPVPGAVLTREIVLLDKHVPLPPGQWRVAASGFGRVADEDPGPYGAIGGVLLVSPEPSRRDFLLIHTNALPVRNGWGIAPECASDKALAHSIGETHNLHNGCSFVMATRAGWLAASHLPALGDEAAARTSLPPWALIAGFRVSDRRDVLDIRYGVVPDGYPAFGWFGANDILPARQKMLIDGLSDWTQRTRAVAMAALRDPIAQVPPMTAPPLRASAEEAGTGEEISASRLALYKLATYRLPSSMLTLGLSWVLTANFLTAAELTLWSGLTHSLVFLGNELAWEWPRPSQPTSFVRLDRPATGGDRPQGPPPPSGPSLATFTVDGKILPLPGSGWTLLATDSNDGMTATVLGKIAGTTLQGLVIARTNQTPRTDILGTSSECSRSDIPFAVIRYDTPVDGYCAYGKQVVVDTRAAPGDTVWPLALQRLQADGVALPPSLMVAGTRARTRENVLDVRYYFAPDPKLIAPNHDDTGVSSDPAAALQAWADLMQDSLEQGVRGRLPSVYARAPWPWDTEVVNSAIPDQAIAPLQALAAAHVLTAAALADQREKVEAGLVERERQRWSLWTRSAYKVSTYRAASYVDSTAVGWLVTGSATQGFALATISGYIRPILAYINELGWANSSIGKASAPLLPVDFPEIGRDFH